MIDKAEVNFDRTYIDRVGQTAKIISIWEHSSLHVSYVELRYIHGVGRGKNGMNGNMVEMPLVSFLAEWSLAK